MQLIKLASHQLLGVCIASLKKSCHIVLYDCEHCSVGDPGVRRICTNLPQCTPPIAIQNRPL